MSRHRTMVRAIAGGAGPRVRGNFMSVPRDRSRADGRALMAITKESDQIQGDTIDQMAHMEQGTIARRLRHNDSVA